MDEIEESSRLGLLPFSYVRLEVNDQAQYCIHVCLLAEDRQEERGGRGIRGDGSC